MPKNNPSKTYCCTCQALTTSIKALKSERHKILLRQHPIAYELAARIKFNQLKTELAQHKRAHKKLKTLPSGSISNLQNPPTNKELQEAALHLPNESPTYNSFRQIWLAWITPPGLR